jgi:hypothetical protein
MRTKIAYALAALTALIVTPPIHNYAQADRIKPGVGGEVLLVIAAVLLVEYIFLKVWQLIEKRKGGEDE